MGVLKEYHRQGIGREMFMMAKNIAREKGYSFLQVKTVQMGKYEDYDIVTGIWPIVPDYLFDQYRTEYSNATNGLRYKLIERISNGLQGIANLDPVLINPTIGISIKRNDGLARKRNMVGKMESIQHDYYIHEFPGSEKYYYNNVVCTLNLLSVMKNIIILFV